MVPIEVLRYLPIAKENDKVTMLGAVLSLRGQFLA